MTAIERPALTKKDFASDQDVRWCPGCGDYAILAAVQRTLPKLAEARENVVVVSGIGCSSRFPYYMNTYGFHTIHGRAPAIATGLKLANRDLDVWVVTGDGDGLSIGGNHMLHVLRRNVDLQILLFNNQIYGLTKGQYSPTSRVGQRSPSTPYGSVDLPVEPAPFALGAGGRFVARGYDTAKQLPELLTRAQRFPGAGFIEILQNCPVFNNDAFIQITARKTAPAHQLWLEHGRPMVFADGKKGVRVRPGTVSLEVVSLGGPDGLGVADLLTHDETDRTLGLLVASMTDPVAFGVLHADPTAPTYDRAVHAQLDEVTRREGPGDLQALLHAGHTWTVP